MKQKIQRQTSLLILSLFLLALGWILGAAGCGGGSAGLTGGGGNPGPNIASLSPTSGLAGTPVTIAGTNFGATQGTSTVKFNGIAGTPTSWSATSIVVPVPSGATTGNVVVTVGGVASNGVNFTVTAPAPSITSLTPSSGLVGTSVTITGSNFGATQGASTVKFNGTAATPTSWSATSIVAPVPSGATTGNVVVTVGGVASNGISFTVTTSGTPKFPIKASANGRYFTDANGVPWLMVADAGHHLMPAIAQSAVAAYLTDRINNGFNAIDFYFMCAGAGTCPASGAAFDGTLPFTTGSGPSSYDLSTPNSAYWSEVDSVVSKAAADGLVVFVNPIPWGVAFSSTLQNNGATKDFNFGAFVGNRYKNYSNIIWHVGQDFDASSLPSSTDLNYEAQLIAGIRSADQNHLITCQLNYDSSYSQQANSIGNATYNADLTTDFVYTYYETYDYMLAGYNSSPTLPAIMGEANYETGNNTSMLSLPADAFITRLEMWYPMTSGATGFEFGNEHVNHFDSSWQTNLDTTATTQVKYVAKLFSQYQWWKFAPDQSHALVTAGYGSYNGGNGNLYTANYATTTWDGSTAAMIYTPVSTTLTVNMANFSKSMTAFWYDPTTGNSTAISGSPFTNSGSQNFTTPSTAHSDGTHDWVLVLH